MLFTKIALDEFNVKIPLIEFKPALSGKNLTRVK